MSQDPILVPAPRVRTPSTPASMPRIAMVNMPFASTWRPSIQCGLLKAELERAGHHVHVHYLNLELAARLGSELYAKISDSVYRTLLWGEWLFSVAAFDDEVVAEGEAYRREVEGVDRACEQLGISFDELCHLRASILPSIIEEWADSLNWSLYQIVGFTSTFEQNTSSLALAKRIKERAPGTLCVFGGANFDGEMGPEFVRAFEFIDYAVVGEGDTALIELANAVSRGESALGIPGVIGREAGRLWLEGHAASIHDMDSLPDPDYGDYFTTLFRIGADRAKGDAKLLLPLETARGCWWGQKHHCTFCGLNAMGMAFRSKSPERVLEELRRMSSRYKMLQFEAVDNIMDTRYIDSVCGPLSEQPCDYSIFYEVKANLSRNQLRSMARAGVTSVQPGIESLSTNVLRLMRKGTTLLQNVRFLKWSRYYDIHVAWNLIMGFPGETVADYERQIDLFPLLYHLQPATGVGPIWLERFSPYFFDRSLPVHGIQPKPAYRHIYPTRVDATKVAYFFDCEMEGRLPESLYGQVEAGIVQWQQQWARRRPRFVYQRGPDWISLVDLRRPGEPRADALSGDEALAYEYCGDRERRGEQVAKFLTDNGSGPIDLETVVRMLDGFCDRGLMLGEDGRYLALALPAARR